MEGSRQHIAILVSDALLIARTEHLQRHSFGGCCEGEDGQVGQRTLGLHLGNQAVLRVLGLNLIGLHIGQRHFHLGMGAACLGRMSLIDNHSKPLVRCLGLATDVRELLNGGRDYLGTAVDSIAQATGTGIVIDTHHHAGTVLHTLYVCGKLGIQVSTIGEHNHRVEYAGVVGSMQAGQAMRQPCDGIALARTRRMLNQVVFTGAALFCIGRKRPYGIQLMEARENNGLHRLGLSIVLHTHKSLQDIHKGIRCQHSAVQILGTIPARISRVARAVHAITLVKRKEERFVSTQPRGHLHRLAVQGEVHDGTAVWLEDGLLGIAVPLVLPHGVRGALTRKVVLELHGHHRNAVQKQHHINGIICVIRHGAVAQLAHHFKTICGILGHKIRVFRRYRLEITQAKASTRRHVNGSSQAIDQAICIPVGFKLVAYAL